MPYTAAIDVHADTGRAPEQAPGEDSPGARLEKAGDRLCCVGFVVAGLLGYGLVYWFLVSAPH